MILKRAGTESFPTRLRLVFWPRRSFSRSFSYFGKRIARLRASPHSIAIGLAAGVFAACSPLLGLHIVIALSIAWILSGNLIAAALGTAVSNPLTFPFLVVADIKLGSILLQVPPPSPEAAHHLVNFWSLEKLKDLWQPVLKPMLVGSVPVGIALGLLAYVCCFYSVRAFKARRVLKMIERR